MTHGNDVLSNPPASMGSLCLLMYLLFYYLHINDQIKLYLVGDVL